MLHLKKSEKEEQMKPKVSRRKEINKIRAEINEIENKTNKQTNKMIEKINATKSWFFEKVNKIDNSLARFTKEKREKNQINKIRDKKGKLQLTSQKYRGSYKNTMKKSI